MADPGVTTLQRRVVRALKWMEKQRLQHLEMVMDDSDASWWCKNEADVIADHMKTLRDLWKALDGTKAP
jgi:hypothetical protein